MGILRSIYLILLGTALLSLGCGAGEPGAQSSLKQMGLDMEAQPQAPPAQAQAFKRMIIYNGNVEVIVDDFDEAEKQLNALVEEYEGRLASSETQGNPGTPRSGTWTVRVPAEHFRDFMEALKRLGELRHSKVDSEDITDQFYDLEARIKTNEAEWDALNELLKKSGNKMTDILEVRKHLNEVQTQLDQQKGQRDRWKALTEMSTVVVTLRDRKDYVPPVVPDFGTRIGRTFQGSVQALVSFGKGVVLVVVAVSPWVGVMLIPGVPLLIWWRVRRRKNSTPPPVPLAEAVDPERPSSAEEPRG
jgi:hypothetical protein